MLDYFYGIKPLTDKAKELLQLQKARSFSTALKCLPKVTRNAKFGQFIKVRL